MIRVRVFYTYVRVFLVLSFFQSLFSCHAVHCVSRDGGHSRHPLWAVWREYPFIFLNYFYFITHTNSNGALHVLVYACFKSKFRRLPASWWRPALSWPPAMPPGGRLQPRSALSLRRPPWRRSFRASPPCTWQRRPFSAPSGGDISPPITRLTGLHLLYRG